MKNLFDDRDEHESPTMGILYIEKNQYQVTDKINLEGKYD